MPTKTTSFSTSPSRERGSAFHSKPSAGSAAHTAAAHTATGQLRLLRPSKTCFVTSTCIGYASRPNTGNWGHGDSHPARLAALSAPPLCLRFEPHLAMGPARLDARMDSLLSFPVGLFHP